MISLSENITFGTPVLVSIDIEDDDIAPVAFPDNYTTCVTEGNNSLTNPGNNDVPVADKTLVVDAANGNGLLSNDTEASNEVLRVDEIPVSPPAHGTLYCGNNTTPNRICPDGSFRYVHDGSETPLNEDQFTYKVLDEQDFYDVGVVTICVTPDNDCPELKVDLTRVDEFETTDPPIDLYKKTTDLEEQAGLDPTGLKYEIIGEYRDGGVPGLYGQTSITTGGLNIYCSRALV